MAIPQLSFQIAPIQADLFRIDVVIKNMPAKFLGAAFDVYIDGSEWTYDHYETGPVFENPNNFLALTGQRSQPDKKLVFGITLKRGVEIQPRDGVLASFFIRFPETGLFSEDNKPSVTLAFENEVLSIFQDGRQDLQEVEWSSAEFLLTQTVSSEQGNPQVEEDTEEQFEDSVQSQIFVDEEYADIPQDTLSIYLLPSVLGILFLGLVGFIFFKKYFLGKFYNNHEAEAKNSQTIASLVHTEKTADPDKS